jgi:DnaB-like helicase C terminal domain
MREFSDRCEPPWSERELSHKVQQAAKQPGERGYLRNSAPERWSKISVPTYAAPVFHEPRQTTLVDAARSYIESIHSGKSNLFETGIGDLDYALGGGVERGEMVIFAARPSHGKSAVGLQCVHHWTAQGMPCAIVSEEMSALALGKRTVQHFSDIPPEHWLDLAPELDKQLAEYASARAPCIILEGCGTADAAAEAIDRAVVSHGIGCVVVDYAQLLGSPGKSRYEQMTNTSIKLRQLASANQIVLLALCQMNRTIEDRGEFLPVMKDLKDTGQLEQDADVIVFSCAGPTALTRKNRWTSSSSSSQKIETALSIRPALPVGSTRPGRCSRIRCRNRRGRKAQPSGETGIGQEHGRKEKVTNVRQMPRRNYGSRAGVFKDRFLPISTRARSRSATSRCWHTWVRGALGIHSLTESRLVRALHLPADSDADLARVVEAWPELPDAIRRGILALVGVVASAGSACSEQQRTHGRGDLS